MDQYLYRLFGAGDILLYAGVSDDWTRRLRQHWLSKHWATEVLTVTLETYPSRPAVLAAERMAIKAEEPRYNIQHNRRGPVPEEETTIPLSAADIILIAALVIAAGFVVYELSQAAIEKYRTWKADRDEFRAWQHARDANDDRPAQGTQSPSAVIITPTAVTRPAPAPPGTLDAMAVVAFYASLHRPAISNRTPSAGSPKNDTQSPT